MKLHIPLSLRAAVLGAMTLAFAMPSMAKDYNLGTSTTPNKDHGLDTSNTVTLNAGDRVGYIDGNVLYGIEDTFTTGVKTPNLSFRKDLIISGGQLAIGGGSNSSNLAKLTVSNGTVTVENEGSLCASNAEIKNLTINSGNVYIRTHGQSGGIDNWGSAGTASGGGAKQSRVTNKLSITGGNLYMGLHVGPYVRNKGGHPPYHFYVAFGKEIEQLGGYMTMRGDGIFYNNCIITQGGTNTANMYYTDNMAIDGDSSQAGKGGTLTINQSNNNAYLFINRLTSTYNDNTTSKTKSATILQTGNGTIHLAGGTYFNAASTVDIEQSGAGKIDIGGCITTKIAKAASRATDTLSDSHRSNVFVCNNTTYTLKQNGANGTITLKKGAAANQNANITVSDITQDASNKLTLESGTKLTATGAVTICGTLSNAGTFTSSNFILGNGGSISTLSGLFTIGSGSAGSAGALNVTTGGTFGVVLNDQTTGAFTLGTGKGATAWKMASGSTYCIGFTGDFLNTLSIDANNKLAFSNVLVATVADGGSASIADSGISYILGDIGGTDTSRWTLDSSSTALTTDKTTGNVVLSGALIYNPWIEVKNGGTVTEAYGDTNTTKKLYTGLAISEKTVVLNADNTHSYGTKIDGGTNGITVTLGAEKALGTGANVEEGRAAVETSGKTTLETADKVVANLPGTIDNTGDLTMKGTYTATDDALGGKTTVEDAYFNLEGEKITTKDGFLRAGSEGYKVVNNIDTATLNPTDTTVTVGGSTYYLYETGYAGLNLIDYSTYYMNSADHKAVVSEIIVASDKLSNSTDITDTVVMNDGKLTVDASIKVDFTGGEVIMAEGGDVTGTINDTEVKAEGGAISADIKGFSSVTVTNDTTLSGDESNYTGGTLIDNATLTLASKQALGDSAVTTKGAAGLETAGGIVANLPATITIEDGSLSMSGKFEADSAKLNNGGLPETQADAWFDTEGKAGNGFMREGGDAYRVVDVTKGTLKVNALDDVSVTVDGTEYQLYSDGLAGGKLDYSTYYIKGEHEVTVSEIHAANDSDTDTTKVVLESEDGALTADSSIDVEATGGSIDVTNDATVSGTIADTDITSTGGTIAATVSGDSSITATGTTTISGANSYNGGTIIDNAELIAQQADSLGTGLVTLKNGATLDLSGAAVANAIRVEGCTLRGGSAYEGDMEVLNNLNLGGATTANKVTLVENGSLTGGSMTTTTLDVQTSGDANLGTDLTIRDGGLIVLNNGKVLNVSGSLTLAGSTTLELAGAYQVGDVLVNSEKALTMGSVELVYADDTVELERVGNSIILVSKFKQPIAEALTQGNWGIVTASRAFVNTVRGQRNNTGCITTGKGTVWVSVLGARNNLKGADVSVEGAAIGADMKVGKSSVLGIALGYTEGKVTPDGQSRISQDGYYAAVYGEHGLRQLSATSNLSFDWVAAYGTTENRQNSMEWEQDSLQVNARINWNKQLNSRVRFNAFAGLEYFASNSGDADGASSGSLQNLRGEVGVGASYVAMGTPAGMDDKTGNAGCEKLVLHGELRFMCDLVRNNPVIEMAGLRGEGYNPGRHGVGVEAGATYRINNRWTTSANYSFNAMEDANEHRFNLGASYSF